jgi:threonine dehydratase
MEVVLVDLASGAIAAAGRIGEHIRETPLEHSPFFSELTGANVYLKLENLQLTGSFKLRGAFNKLLSLTPEQTRAGCVTASSGNHGAAVAHAMQELGASGIVFVPEKTSPTKVDAIRRAGAELRHFGTDQLDTEEYARQFAAENEMTFLSPYNDPVVVAGQGSCGVEIDRQISELDALFVSIGGGGLISGVASYLKSVYPNLDVIGCQPAASAVMAESIRAGEILDLPSAPTLSDGTAGGVESDAITFGLCQQLVDDYVLVSEGEIAEAMRGFIDSHHMLLEGAAGVALAGLQRSAEKYRGRNVVVIICGGNISRETLRSVI